MKIWTNPTVEELEIKLTAHGNDMNHCEVCHNSVGNSNGNASNGHGGEHGSFDGCVMDDDGTPLS